MGIFRDFFTRIHPRGSLPGFNGVMVLFFFASLSGLQSVKLCKYAREGRLPNCAASFSCLGGGLIKSIRRAISVINTPLRATGNGRGGELVLSPR